MRKCNVYTEEERYWMTGGNTGMLPQNVSPSEIHVLEADEVFVFGSNAMGLHLGGAARMAHKAFGAEWGNGEGLQGSSYAIPTMEGVESMKEAVGRFTDFAGKHPERKFLVTAIGCGIAGYSVEEVAPMFEAAAHLQNVFLPLCFWKVLIKG